MKEGGRQWNVRKKKFTSTDPEIEIRKTASNKIKDIWPKSGMYLEKYKHKWKRVMKQTTK
jgi:hypothetical protein